ncbi:MAG: VOC family protein [Actinomycetota bacterium]
MTPLKEVALFTPNVERVAAFYESLLGISPIASMPGMNSYLLGGVDFHIHVAEQVLPARQPAPFGDFPPGEDHIAFACDDLDAAAVALIAEGHTVLGPMDFPWGRSMYVRDPDGRLVELS